jgi:coenzyme PQQ biosynthesis protein C
LSTLLSPAELEAALHAIGARRYHNLHPFHQKLHGGDLSLFQIQAWVLNRYYYQSQIPVKDASLLARLPTAALRREWRLRLIDHDGDETAEGGVARWLRLAEHVGLDLDYVISTKGLLPGTRFAVDAYVHFVRERSVLEAVASSLTEIFSPKIIAERVAGLLSHYDFITPEMLAYFEPRLTQAPKDVIFALSYVTEHARTVQEQTQVLDALRFKCDVLWSQLDALHFSYVSPGLIPPDAFAPGTAPHLAAPVQLPSGRA